MAKALACLCCLMLFASIGVPSPAGRPGGFVVLGPGGGGAMFHPTISPHDPNTVLVACDMTGAYMTHDGGQTWRMFNLRGVVRFFAFDPRDPKTIYAGTKALWRSTDGGESWALVYPKPSSIKQIRMASDHADETIVAQPDPLGTILALAIDPDDNRILYAASTRDNRSAVFVSRDQGETWEQFHDLREAPLRIWVDARSDRQKRTLIVAATTSIAIVSSGQSQTHPSAAELTDVSFGVPAMGDAVIYATTAKGLFVTANAGASWQKANIPGGH